MKSYEYIDNKNKKVDLSELLDDNKELKDVTQKFLNCIRRNKNNAEFGFIMSINGSKGSGKTTKALILAIEFFLANPKKRRIGIWSDSKTLVPALNKYAPENMRNIFYKIKDLSDIKNWHVVVVDEGANIFDAKQALRKDLRNTGKGITIIRHKAIIFIICSVRKNSVFKSMREDAEIRIYNYCNTQFLQDNKFKFVKDHRKELKKLSRIEALIDSDQYYFRKRGMLILDGESQEKWKWIIDHDKEISRNMSKVSLDIEGTQEANRQEILIEIAMILIEKFKSKFKNAKIQKAAKAWIKNRYPEYINYLSSWNDIVEQAFLCMYNTGEFKRKKRKTKKIERATLPEISNDKMIVADYFKQYYKKNLIIEDFKSEDRFNWIIDIIYNWCGGLSYNLIRKECGGSPNTISKWLRNFQTGEDLDLEIYRFSYALECYAAGMLKADHIGGKGKPDLCFKNENNEVLFPAEVKLITPKGNTCSIYKFSRDPRVQSLNPSFVYCKKYKIPRFPLIYFYPKWSDYPILIPIEVPLGDYPDNYEVIISKRDSKKYLENFLLFDKMNFLEK